MIAGDFKLTSVDWFNLSTDSAKNPLLDMLDDLNSTQTVNFPTVHANTNTLDLIFVSSAVKITQQYAIEKAETLSSNHKPICIQFLSCIYAKKWSQSYWEIL